MNTYTKNLVAVFALTVVGCSGTPLQQPDPSTSSDPSTTSPTTLAIPSGLTGTTTRNVVVHDVTTTMDILLDDTTVLCSSADYSSTFLKVLIPAIASVTVFDHTNAGAGAPCIAAGECTETLNPASIIDPGYPEQVIGLRVLRTQRRYIDHDAKTCQATLDEELFTTIREVAFYHKRSGNPMTLAYADCIDN